jgi:hypothetical protein
MTLIAEDLIPPSPPEPGQETAQVVWDIVRLHPDRHDQSTWEAVNTCGTTRCIAGWAQYIHHKFVDGRCPFTKGKRLLCLSEQDAILLFHCTSQSEAVEALGYVAKGDRIPWDNIFPNEIRREAAYAHAQEMDHCHRDWDEFNRPY